MLINFFDTVRAFGIPASTREYLDLLRAMEGHVIFADNEAFYQLSRAILVKDERYYDRFDKACKAFFDGIESIDDLLEATLPEEWLRKEFINQLSEEEQERLKALGSLEALMETLKKRLQEQKKRHAGGNKWIGTGGTSPFGAYGNNPMGVRIGQQESRNQRATKVWDKREFQNLDDDERLGSRNMKMALRRLRKFARQGTPDQLDLDDTIRSTANKGLLDIKMVPQRRNSVKVLLFMDIGGSMDAHIKVCETLFSCARSEFKYMEFFYFHNYLYESVWKNNLRRHNDKTETWDIIHRFGKDYKVIFVGDAQMSPYEVTSPGGSVEHWNDEPGHSWMQRVLDHFDNSIWLNPINKDSWPFTHSTKIIHEQFEGRMFPLTVKGLEEGMKALSTKS
ncbi:VWA domain-containing protein [Endozoicomonas sp. 4G]|uniref:vWA domain-containing protein n=1 Tax=Endozoicomonas sp. 4G TaxID=2872754 RepID=UPI002078C408|nr:VWA domain-containing protein [Endozoicomonas sp. 4G]